MGSRLIWGQKASGIVKLNVYRKECFSFTAFFLRLKCVRGSSQRMYTLVPAWLFSMCEVSRFQWVSLGSWTAEKFWNHLPEVLKYGILVCKEKDQIEQASCFPCLQGKWE